MTQNYIDLRKKAKALTPILHIGKNGITDSLILEIEKTLKKKKLVKIKINKGALDGRDRKEIAKEIVEKTGAKLIDFIGFNIVLYKE
jgi:RNA-binding protein